ncbi:MAG TPA: type II secretion system protein GspG [Polyangia bacterium]|jgi:general secretion pathway protein G|nr:type II secretion system protein GspG [Polyangia bacterium]
MTMTAGAARCKRWMSRGARAAERGFTLLEIMIVLAIMGLIVTGVSIKVFSQLKKAKTQAARIGVKKIGDAAARFMAGAGAGCPKGLDELIAQGELSKSDAKDPWGTAYVFRCPGTQDTEGVDVISWGPDKVESADDVKSWEIQ